MEGLSDEFSVVTWDAPGAGASSDPPESFTVADWAECLAQLLEVISVGPAHVVGLSWGGILAQELYRLYPQRVRSFVFADTYGGWKGSFSESVARQRLERCRRESFLRAEEFVRRWVPHEFFTAAATSELADEMAAVVADFHPLGFRLMAQSLADTDSTALLPMIDVPTLLLWGDATLVAQSRSWVPNFETRFRGPSWWSSRTLGTSAIWNSRHSSMRTSANSVRRGQQLSLPNPAPSGRR